jgi:CheY-like chemotaxis protein
MKVEENGATSVMRVLQNGQILARLSAVREHDDRLTAVWQGAPLPFQPSEQLEPLVLESEDGLHRTEGWLLSVLKPARGDGPLRVEFGAERIAPPWRRSGFPPLPRRPSSSPHEGGEPTLVGDILVVDDDREIVGLVAEALEEEGFIVRRAFGGREALALAAERPPDVAIIDLIMPEIDGEQVCVALRRDAKFAKTRVLVLSGAEDTRTVAAGCDADGAITKPFTSELLVREVRRLTEQ